MNNISLNIVLGIFSGILTSALLFTLNRIFLEVVVPWYQQLIYEGVDLRDSWLYDRPKGDGVGKFRLKLEQKAHNLSGQLTYTSIEKDTESVISYLVSGTVWEGYVTLNLKSSDRRRIAFATTLLKVERGGQELKGWFCFRNFHTDQVSSTEILLTRGQRK
jgi:hypothetical protein